MKTLDEVIDSITKQSGLEIRDQFRPEKDRFWVDRDTYNDALYYLRMYYSDKVQWESDRKHYENWIEQYKEARDKHQQAVKEMLKNPPLTWDELKQMEGKPVWVEGSHGCIWNHKSWALISFNKIGDMKCQLYDACEFWIGKEDYGSDWQAYRKERTDGEEC